MPSLEKALDDSVRFLASPEALDAFAANCYWPKWDGPWWHLRLLYELGYVDRIPAPALDGLVHSLEALPCHVFPITPEEQAHVNNPWIDTGCHCQVGTMFTVLSEAGIDVSQRLPWMRSWLSSYQMRDGGFNCDEEAYRIAGECPSSMVATVAILEALLALGPQQWTAAERGVARAGLSFLLDRGLVEGAASLHNAEERQESLAWSKLCFPRFYHYDILRGLTCLVNLSVALSEDLEKVPSSVVAQVTKVLQSKATGSGGYLCTERRCYEGHRTLRCDGRGQWTRGHDAAVFPLLELVSVPGDVSQALTNEWLATSQALRGMGLMV